MGKYKSWSEKEFRAYLFLYAADSNFEYNAEEKSFIEAPFACAVAVDVRVLTVVPLVTPVKEVAVTPV